jgi:formate hydrogenlyase transcriptional activator
MDAQPLHSAEEIKRLQRCINDLVSVITLPSIWTGGEASQIVGTLLDVLLNILPLDIVYARLKNPGGGPPLEIFRVAGAREPIPQPHEIGEVFSPWWGADPQIWPPRVRNPLGEGDLSIVPMRLGLQGEIGVIVAASPRADFPGQTERLVLSVAANQAAVGLHEARLLSEHKRVERELDQKVEQRTREVSAANEELRKEITERERAEAARRHSEEQFRNVVDTATDAVVSIDETGHILYLNPAITRIFGYSAAELIGQSLTILMPRGLRDLHHAGFERYLRTGQRHLNWQGVELTAVRKGGEEFPVEISFGEVASNSQHVFTGFIRDITERKEAEELRQARARQSAIRADISHALTGEEDLRVILQRCAEAMVQHLDVAFARIWTRIEDARLLEMQASAGMYTHIDGPHSRIPVGDLKIGLIAESKRPHLTNDVIDDPRINDKAWAKKEGMVAFAGYPLVVDDRAVGVMAVFSRTPLSTGILDTLAAVADSISQGIERKRTGESLRKSEERFRLLVEGVQDYAIFMLDPEGRVVTWNEGAERIKGYRAEEILGRQFSRFYEKGDIELGKPEQELKEAEDLGRSRVEGWRVRKDGSRYWAEVMTTSIKEKDGKLVGYAKIIRDLTERKRFERDLQHERDRLRLLLDLNNRTASNLDLHQLFQALLTELKQIMECEFVGLALPETKGDQLRLDVLECVESNGSIQQGMLIPIHGSAAGQSFRTGKAVVVSEVGRRAKGPDPYAGANGETYERTVATEGLKISCYLPLTQRDHALGILHLAWRREHPLAQQDVDFLRQIASQISIAVDNALNYRQVNKSRVRLAAEKQYLEEEIRREYNPDEIVGDSPGLLKLLQLVEQVAPTDSNVLISGETGTGKELIARAVHTRSMRKDRPLVKVNCGAIPAGLVESELFGHVKGAFTGATVDRTGRFELADGGTLFLDEVGELPLDTQVKLLRVLQEQEFEPVGSSRTVHVDVRIIAASNRDLTETVRAGLFRSDLFYRLNVLPLHVPALRERQSDIPQILMFFLSHYSQRMGKRIEAISPDTMERLVSYSWPGNIRELRNVIERGVVLSPSSAVLLGLDLLPPEISNLDSVGGAVPLRRRAADGAVQAPRQDAPRADAPSLEELERQHILKVLEQAGWKISGPKGAAEILKLHPNTLRDRMNKLRISRSSHGTP